QSHLIPTSATHFPPHYTTNNNIYSINKKNPDFTVRIYVVEKVNNIQTVENVLGQGTLKSRNRAYSEVSEYRRF
ncbi:MAG: hypothetical protein AB7V16_10425, partial [Vulcanibacillus sp.]